MAAIAADEMMVARVGRGEVNLSGWWFDRAYEATARFRDVIRDVAAGQGDAVGVVNLHDLPFSSIQVGRPLFGASSKIPVIAVLHGCARIA